MERILKPMFRFIFFWIRIVKKKYREISYREIVSGSGAASIEPTPKSRHPKADTQKPTPRPRSDTQKPTPRPRYDTQKPSIILKAPIEIAHV